MTDAQADPSVEPVAVFDGYVDAVTDRSVGGWALGGEGPVTLVARLDGREIARTNADIWRSDLGRAAGFTLPLTLEDLAGKLLCGRLVLLPEDPDSAPLRMADGLKGWLIARFFCDAVPTLDASQLRAVLATIQAHLVGEDRDYGTLEILDGAPAGEMTEVPMPVGLRSLDQEAVVRRQGHIFLVRGTNDLLHQYRQRADDPTPRSIADQWLVRIRQRRDDVSALGIGFFQCVVPEKSSLLYDLFPCPIDNRTAISKRLEPALLADAALAPHYLSGLSILAPVGERAFQKLDTHLAPKGAHAIAIELARRAGVPPLEGIEFGDTLSLGGDVGRRLLSPFARQHMAAPSGDAVHRLGRRLECVERRLAPTMTGSRVTYRNPGAPSPLKVIAYANSFCDLGDNPTQISWWLARIFAEYHFVWSPELDLDDVRLHRPDVVFCQTIERFLSKPVGA